MNNLRGAIVSILLLSLTFSQGEDEKEPVSIGITSCPIEGTQLILQNISQKWLHSKKVTHHCVIGYTRDTETGVIFIPVLNLPTLENDIYVINYSKGVLRVSSKGKPEVITSLHLSSIAPTLIKADFDEAAYNEAARSRWKSGSD